MRHTTPQKHMLNNLAEVLVSMRQQAIFDMLTLCELLGFD